MEVKLIKYTIGFVGVSAGVAFAATLPQDLLLGIVSEAFKHQVTQFTLAFTLAAWLHSGRVSKEIKAQMGGMATSITASIDRVAVTLRQDLQAQNARLGVVEVEVKNLSGRVGKVEQDNQQKGQTT